MPRPNRLVGETSPYLLQHAHNPVDWFPWGDEAFERARAENKPVLLSIGYSSCHWCHVMEHESFDNPGIAGLMNELFVSIKVDREERPDIDDVYMKAVQLLIGRGGWPLTVFLTPDRQPFHGGTYFPPVDRHGLPAFPRVLQAIARAYHERAEDVSKAAGEILAGVERIEAASTTSGLLDPGLPERAALALLRHVDRVHGGLGGAPKFSHSQALHLMLRHHRTTKDPELLDAVRLTCQRMAAGGMYDQIGGGFHRYSVDERWLVPHFEKMLYDNAVLPRLYLDAYQVTREEGFRRIVEQTLDYLLREMRDPGGAFYSATDADSEGEEGKFFVWTRAEVAHVVAPEDADLVCRFWDISDEGNFEGKSIAHSTLGVEEVAGLFGRLPEATAQAIERARAQLYAARANRVPPLRDEKIIVAWNALVISGLADAGRVLDNP
ncbi:MAG: thioredoxin domain-containing protein, partial [Thermoanaerobaculia bacterium]